MLWIICFLIGADTPLRFLCLGSSSFCWRFLGSSNRWKQCNVAVSMYVWRLEIIHRWNVRAMESMMFYIVFNVVYFIRLNLSKNMSRFNEVADSFEQLPMYFMTFHGQENIKKVIEVSFRCLFVMSQIIIEMTAVCHWLFWMNFIVWVEVIPQMFFIP